MPSDAELLKSYLAEREVPCPGCGYSLKGCASDKCPECGADIALCLTTTSRSSKWIWLLRAALLSFILTGGHAAYNGITVLVTHGWRRVADPLHGVVMIWLIVALAALATPIGLWLLVRTFGARSVSHAKRVERATVGVLVLIVLVEGCPWIIGALDVVLAVIFGWQ